MLDPVDGVTPKPKRIVQDIKRAISAMTTITKHRGVFVPGLAGGRVAGHRHILTTAKTSNDPEQDVTERFAVYPEDLHPEEYAELEPT